MTFEQALTAMRAGSWVRLPSWKPDFYYSAQREEGTDWKIIVQHPGGAYPIVNLAVEELFAEDWTVQS